MNISPPKISKHDRNDLQMKSHPESINVYTRPYTKERKWITATSCFAMYIFFIFSHFPSVDSHSREKSRTTHFEWWFTCLLRFIHLFANALEVSNKGLVVIWCLLWKEIVIGCNFSVIVKNSYKNNDRHLLDM